MRKGRKMRVTEKGGRWVLREGGEDWWAGRGGGGGR